MKKLVISIILILALVLIFFFYQPRINFSPTPNTPSFCSEYDPSSPDYNQQAHIQCCKDSFDSCVANCRPGFLGENCRGDCGIKVNYCLERAGVIAPPNANCQEKNRGCERSCDILYPEIDDGWLYCMRSCSLQYTICCTLNPSQCYNPSKTPDKAKI